MNADKTGPKTIDKYIAGFPMDVQEILQKIRLTIREAAPEVQETISYQMPTFNLNGKYLVYFAAFKRHIGFYPAPIGIPEFEEDLSVYGSGKGTIQFPYDRPIPYELVTRIVKFRVKENLEKENVKGRKK